VGERDGGPGSRRATRPACDWIFGDAIRAVAPEGRILVVGFAAGEITTLHLNRLLLKNIDPGVAWGAFLDVDPALCGPRRAAR
jgi:NADPH:quinone reductase